MPATDTIALQIELSGETRTVTFSTHNDRALSLGLEAYGVFPTGRKAHRTGLVVWAVDGLRRRPGRFEQVVTDENGREWVLDTVLYTHNRNSGRIVGWADAVPPNYIARW